MTTRRSRPDSAPPLPGVAALILAAGESTRMGSLKQLLPWQGEPLVAYQVRQMHRAGVADVVVVAGHAAEQVGPVAAAAGARLVHNPAYRSGRASSIRAGAGAVADGVRALVTLNVDQPRTAAVVRRVLDAHLAGDALITTPEQGGRRGHPVVFDGSLLPELRAVDEASEGLRAVLRRHAARRAVVPVDDPRIHVELNTPEEYQRALATAERSGRTGGAPAGAARTTGAGTT